MHAPYTAQLDRSQTAPSLVPQAAGLISAPDCRGFGGQRGSDPSGDGTGPQRQSQGSPASASAPGPAAAVTRATGPLARGGASRAYRLQLSRRTVAPQSGRCHYLPGIWGHLSSASCGPHTRCAALESAKTRPACSAAQRSHYCAVARRNLAGHQNGAQIQQQTIFFIDESGFYPLPSVVCSSAPVGQTPILREWCTHDHLSALSAISPEGKLYFHAQEHSMNSADVVAFWEHLLREVPGRLVLI
jgi:hypothetical protein